MLIQNLKSMHALLLALFTSSLGAICATVADADDRHHSFNKFPVKKVFVGKTTYPQFGGRDRKFSDFRTRIREALNHGPNFGGEYTVVEIGCGTSCLLALVANNKTGEVYKFPLGGEDNYQMQLLYKLNSSLIIAQWMDTSSSKCVLEYLSFNGSEYDMLGRMPIGNDETCYKLVLENVENAE